ncbi:MAG: hypothetical protein PSX81_15840 [bacterium]|nr:hypothetical protein [bacterium]
MRRFLNILTLFMIAFFLMPNTTFASNSAIVKSCCQKEDSKAVEGKNCCKNHNHLSNEKKDCNGQCGDKSCHCTAFHFSGMTLVFQENIILGFDFPIQNKQSFHSETYLSSGFYAIWLPPNIG